MSTKKEETVNQILSDIAIIEAQLKRLPTISESKMDDNYTRSILYDMLYDLKIRLKFELNEREGS